MKNERITEDFVRQHFQGDPLFIKIKLEEQKTSVPKAKKCLATASKKMTGKAGQPEFIITFPAYPDNIIVIECKADAKKHKSAKVKKSGTVSADIKPAEYAVDGALHYSKHLSKEYNVLSIAVSGSSEKELMVSSFLQKRNDDQYVEQDRKLLDIHSYLTIFEGGFAADSIEHGEITRIAIELNNELNDYSIVEYERCTLISAILLALRDETFRKTYQSHARTTEAKPRPDRIADEIINATARFLEENRIDDARIKTMLSEYNKIKNSLLAQQPKIKKKKATEHEDNYVLRNITEKLERLLPLATMGNKGHDLLGRFYTEFIRYAGTDKKTGLVLTPQHITEFFCDVANVTKDDVVFDPCCGTARFLISAMKKMLFLAENDERKKAAIKKKQLLGIEIRSDMFTYACSNMLMSGDGKSNIYKGDCLSDEYREKTNSPKPTVAFLNPPYDVGEDGQLRFIENALSCLQKGGRCVAIVQMSGATSASKETVNVRNRLLKQHTLNAVFSMPDDLFYPVGVITCVMALEAHKPHPSNFKTYFGYFKDDGFVKTKHMGRINTGEWDNIKQRWLNSYLNKEQIPGLSVTHPVNGEDEWCAEAYMETDYSTLTESEFIETVKNFVAFEFLAGKKMAIASDQASKSKMRKLSPEKWGVFKYTDIFDIRKGSRLTKNAMTEGNTPFIGAIDSNNGYRQHIDAEPDHSGNVITVNYNGSVAESFYQPIPFCASDDVNVLYPKVELTPYIAMFLCSLIRREKFRFNYGRKWKLGRMKESIIRLPVTVSGDPDWALMESYIKSLPYSANLEK